MGILLTGGLGYIGSHTAVELLQKNEDIIIVDNLSNSKIETVEKLKKITGKNFKFVKADLKDFKATEKLFKKHNISAIVHFAGLKAVGESVQIPVEYYENNLMSTLNLLKEHGGNLTENKCTTRRLEWGDIFQSELTSLLLIYVGGGLVSKPCLTRATPWNIM